MQIKSDAVDFFDSKNHFLQKIERSEKVPDAIIFKDLTHELHRLQSINTKLIPKATLMCEIISRIFQKFETSISDEVKSNIFVTIYQIGVLRIKSTSEFIGARLGKAISSILPQISPFIFSLESPEPHLKEICLQFMICIPFLEHTTLSDENFFFDI